MSKITSHGRREGAADYRGRAAEVAAGREKPTWAWPLAGADEAYLDAVGIDSVCRQIGIAPDKWESVCHEWLTAFRAGYEEAHAADEYPHDDLDSRLGDALRASGINAADALAVQALYAIAGQSGSHRIVSALRAIEAWLREGGAL